MTIRLNDLPLDKTDAMMRIIIPIMKQDERVLFLCPSGEGRKIVQRIRVMMSRARKKIKAKKKRIQHFTVHHTIHPHTEAGFRFDAVIMWRSRSEANLLNEIMEDLLSE